MLLVFLINQTPYPEDNLEELDLIYQLFFTSDRHETPYYTIVRKRRYDGRTTLRVMEPEGYKVKIINKYGRTIERGYIPLKTFVGIGGRYTIAVEGVWSGDVYIKKGYDNYIFVKLPSHRDDWETIVEETEYYRIIRRPYFRTILKVLRPVDYRIVVLNEFGDTVYEGTIPMRKKLREGGFYRIIIRDRDGYRIWDHRVEIYDDYENILYVKPGSFEEKPKPMTEEQFRRLLETLKDESFSDTKLDILKEAARYNWFTSEQVARILEVFDFDEDRLKAAKMLYPRVVDKENFYIVYSRFEFSSTKEELRRWIERHERGTEEEEDEWEEGWD